MLSLILLVNSVFSNANNTPHSKNARFIENKGQWPKNVLFGARLASGMVFIENDGIRFNQYSPESLNHAHEHQHGKNASDSLKAHNFKIQFLNALTPICSPAFPYQDHVNYFLGNTHWGTSANVYQEILLQQIYAGIDVRFYENNSHFKFDFIVHPGANPNQINLKNRSISSHIENNQIILTSAVGNIILQQPLSYQIENHTKKIIRNYYAKSDDDSYHFKLQDYSKNNVLIIDPAVYFASFSGSTADNWGFTATYDDLGNLYNAGNVFGTGYPITTGVYQTTFAGIVDVSVTKYNI
ncbi:MAG: hypothetical protein ACO3EE_06595, partial [Flavobacteriales bacterium]